MDGSKRSSHSNAYFSGFGKRKRIALSDTLVEQHSPDELLAILAHEIGHYKEKHVARMTVVSIAQIGILFGVMSLFLGNEQLFAAFGMEDDFDARGAYVFWTLYSPVSFVLGIGQTHLSRKHEYEADAYAAETLKTSISLIAGLKRLSVKNLGNLTPHCLRYGLATAIPLFCNEFPTQSVLKCRRAPMIGVSEIAMSHDSGGASGAFPCVWI